MKVRKFKPLFLEKFQREARFVFEGMREPRAGIPKRRLTSSRSSMHTDTAHWTRSEHLYKLYLRNPWNTIIVRGTNRRFSMENALVASPWINIKLNIAKPSIHLDIVLHDITKVSSFFTGSFSFSWNNRVDKSVVSMTRNDPWRARIPKSRIRRSRRTLCQKIWSINFDKTSVFSIKIALKEQSYGILVKRTQICEKL